MALLVGMILAVVMRPGPALAEELRGELHLKSGLPIPGVELKLCSKTTGVCGTAFTNSAGFFQFSNLTAGMFTLEARPRSGTIRQDISIPEAGIFSVVVP